MIIENSMIAPYLYVNKQVTPTNWFFQPLKSLSLDIRRNTMKRSILLILGLLLLVEVCGAALFVNEGSFYRVFSGKDYFTANSGSKVDFAIDLSTMSSNGEIVAFYGNTYFDSTSHPKLFIHNFEATTDPVEVTLPALIGNFNLNAGMVSNADGSRIFFLASSTEASYRHLFCMLNGLTGEVNILFDTRAPDTEVPTHIDTDANGDYLYFNETDNGDRGDLWRIASSVGALPELIIQAATIGHPSGGVASFIGQFSVSDDGQTIAFFVRGHIEDGGTYVITDKELFVKTASGIRFITNNDQNGKTALVLSGDGSTIVYTRNYEWMVTTPDAVVEGQVQIEEGFHSTGARAGISTDGSIIFASSSPNGESSPEAYLIQTDGSGRKIVGPGYTHLASGTTHEGYHLSGDGKRICFKDRKYIYPDEWYNINVGIFDKSFWTSEIPNIASVNYASDMFERLENDERFDITIGVSDPQGNETIMDLDEIVFLPNGYEARGSEGPISVLSFIVPIDESLYTTEGEQGIGWPSNAPVTVRFSVEDEDGNFGYADTVIRYDPTLFSDDFESSDTSAWSLVEP